MFDAMIASALKRLLDEHVHIRKRVSVEEQRAQKYGRFLRGRQFVYMICEHFRASGAHEPQIFQYPFAGWRQPRFRRSMGSSSIISKWCVFRYDLGRVAQVKKSFWSASYRLGFVWSRNCSKQWTGKLFTIEDICKTSYWSDDENSKFQSPERSCGKRISHQESKRKQSLRGEESGRVFSVESTWTMFQRRFMQFQSWQIGTMRFVQWSERKRTIVFSRTKFEGQDWRWRRKIFNNIRQQRGKLFRQNERNSVPIQNLSQTRHVIFGAFSCVSSTSLTQDANKATNANSEWAAQQKVKERWFERISCIVVGVSKMSCASQDSYLRESIPRERGNFGSKHAKKFSKSTWHQIKIGKERVHL